MRESAGWFCLAGLGLPQIQPHLRSRSRLRPRPVHMMEMGACEDRQDSRLKGGQGCGEGGRGRGAEFGERERERTGQRASVRLLLGLGVNFTENGWMVTDMFGIRPADVLVGR